MYLEQYYTKRGPNVNAPFFFNPFDLFNPFPFLQSLSP